MCFKAISSGLWACRQPLEPTGELIWLSFKQSGPTIVENNNKDLGDGVFGFGNLSPAEPVSDKYGTATVDKLMFWDRELTDAEVLAVYLAQD